MFNKNQVVAVVMGGPSAEREVSLNTGAAIANALREYGYTNVVEIDLDPRNFGKQLAESKAEVVFNAVHGLRILHGQSYYQTHAARRRHFHPGLPDC